MILKSANGQYVCCSDDVTLQDDKHRVQPYQRHVTLMANDAHASSQADVTHSDWGTILTVTISQSAYNSVHCWLQTA